MSDARPTARLRPDPFEWIDRSTTLQFRFEGRPAFGLAGDTVSSALWAGGVRVLGRSFKYHRPRGLLSAANHDVNALMQWGAQLNLRADATPLVAGMDLFAVNTWGGVDRDRLGWLDRLSPFLPVGFYYKAFHRPTRLLPHWERFFRRITGLGRVDPSAPARETAKRYDHCDVLVIGGGPSGLTAALAAAAGGARVVLVDEQPRLGGSLGWQRGDDEPAHLARLLAAVAAEPRLRVMTGTEAAGWYADHWVALVESGRMTKMRARAVIVATGAFEVPVVFRDNDVPGVMTAGAAGRLMHRWRVRPAARTVVVTGNDDGCRAALAAAAEGLAVAGVVDLRAPGPVTAPWAEQMAAARIEYLPGHAPWEARSADGHRTLRGLRVGPFDGAGGVDARRLRDFDADGVWMSGGWTPAAAHLYQAGAAMRFDEPLQQFVPKTLPEGLFACGRVNGAHPLAARLADGERAAAQALAFLGLRAAAVVGPISPVSAPPQPLPGTRADAVAAPGTVASPPSHPWPIVDHPGGKNFVDFDEDLQLKDFVNAAAEGFDNIELLKRYTTVGMGPSQGKHSNMLAVRILAKLRGEPIEAVGTTTARPFFHPVPLAVLAGRRFHPERRTPMHAAHEALGARWMPAGQWLRPEYYPRAGLERTQAIAEEVRAVREAAGLIDVSTLGKIEVFGPDAAELVERVYTGRFASLKVGMTRYLLALDESGVVIDDGVCARLAPQRFYLTTTTSASATMYREIGRWNLQWGLRAGITQLTGAMAAMNLAGPRARAILAAVLEPGALDLSDAAFPYLAVRRAHVAGIDCRLMRVGFVGEWGVELHCPAESGAALWEALMQAGAAHGLRPFGVEAQRVLRLEKGHQIVGQDTDGVTQPFEAGMGWAVKMDKPFFVGQRSLRILQAQPQRYALAGFVLPAGHTGALPMESHLAIADGEIAGRITSFAFSPTLGHHVGLALLRPDLAAGEAFEVRVADGSRVRLQIVPTPFVDPQGARQRLDAPATPAAPAPQAAPAELVAK